MVLDRVLPVGLLSCFLYCIDARYLRPIEGHILCQTGPGDIGARDERGPHLSNEPQTVFSTIQ